MKTRTTAAAPRYTATAGTAPAGRTAAPPGGPVGGMRLRAARDGLATAALALGVTGLFTSVLLVGGLLGVLGVALGVAALKTAGRTGAGRGRAVTGVVTSLFAIALSVLSAVLLAWYANRTQECYRPDSLQQYAQCVRQHLAGS
ncbi:DUF4190 domain-containing protein [Streptomyces sp. NPDC004690]